MLEDGGNVLLMDNGLTQFDLMVGLKITECIRSRLVPNTNFLTDGWHIFSDTPGAFSWMCLTYLKDIMAVEENKFQHWNYKLVSILNYEFIRAKSESGLGF